MAGFKKEEFEKVVEIQKLEFYEKRHIAHYKGIKLAGKLKIDRLADFKNAIKDISEDPNEAKFLIEALDTIIESRRAVAFTYPIGYFVK